MTNQNTDEMPRFSGSAIAKAAEAMHKRGEELGFFAVQWDNIPVTSKEKYEELAAAAMASTVADLAIDESVAIDTKTASRYEDALREAMDFIEMMPPPRCKDLHHAKKDQMHEYGDYPVEKRLQQSLATINKLLGETKC